MKRRSEHASFAEADRALEQTLEDLDSNAPNYNEWIRALMAPAASGTVLELGAGRGTFTLALLQSADKVVAVEPSEIGSRELVRTTAHEPRVVAVQGYASDAAPYGPFDGAVLSNVLEHIEEDVAVLREIRLLMKPGGRVAVLSPAFQLLMSNFDRSIGHVRRYRRADLAARFERAGYEVETARYVNTPGFFAWFVVTRLLNLRPTHAFLSRTYDRLVVPITRRIEAKVSPPFGQSVLVIGRVRAERNDSPE